jgi:hypothetical protein
MSQLGLWSRARAVATQSGWLRRSFTSCTPVSVLLAASQFPPTGGDEHPLQDGDFWPHDLVGSQLLAGQLLEQQGAVVFQGPVEQPSSQSLSLLGVGLAEAQVLLDGEEVVGAGLRPLAIRG